MSGSEEANRFNGTAETPLRELGAPPAVKDGHSAQGEGPAFFTKPCRRYLDAVLGYSPLGAVCRRRVGMLLGLVECCTKIGSW